MLLTVVAAPSLLPRFSVVDNDIWWHLKVGDWIIEHAAIPHTGILSRTAADQPWMAYSWIYEILLSLFHSRFHLVGISIYGLLVHSSRHLQCLFDGVLPFGFILEALSACHRRLRGVPFQRVSKASVLLDDVVHGYAHGAT